MEFGREVLEDPSDQKPINDFAQAVNRIQKVVFSRTLDRVDWGSARLEERILVEEVKALREQEGGDILVGSRSLIRQLLKIGLLDEFTLCIHPAIAGGGGLPLFEGMNERAELRLTGTKTFSEGAEIMYYEPVSEIKN